MDDGRNVDYSQISAARPVSFGVQVLRFTGHRTPYRHKRGAFVIVRVPAA